MTASETEIVETGFRAFAERGAAAIPEFVHPEFEMETLPGMAAEPQIYRGHDGVRRWYESFYEVMDEVTLEPLGVEPVAPGRVKVEFEVTARGQSSGLEVTQRAEAVAVLEDGLLRAIEFSPPD